jgi:hypothetical protein
MNYNGDIIGIILAILVILTDELYFTLNLPLPKKELISPTNSEPRKKRGLNIALSIMTYISFPRLTLAIREVK